MIAPPIPLPLHVSEGDPAILGHSHTTDGDPRSPCVDTQWRGRIACSDRCERLHTASTSGRVRSLPRPRGNHQSTSGPRRTRETRHGKLGDAKRPRLALRTGALARQSVAKEGLFKGLFRACSGWPTWLDRPFWRVYKPRPGQMRPYRVRSGFAWRQRATMPARTPVAAQDPNERQLLKIRYRPGV
jgi:hypothetical protein